MSLRRDVEFANDMIVDPGKLEPAEGHLLKRRLSARVRLIERHERNGEFTPPPRTIPPPKGRRHK